MFTRSFKENGRKRKPGNHQKIYFHIQSICFTGSEVFSIRLLSVVVSIVWVINFI